MFVNTEAAQGTSFKEMTALQMKVNEVLRQAPNIEGFNSSVGGMSFSGLNGANQGRMYIQLLPRAQRKLSSAELVEELRPKITNFPGVRVYMTLPPIIRIGTRFSKSSYDLTIQGPDTADLFVESEKLEKEVAKLPAVAGGTTDLQLKNPRVDIPPDRDQAPATQNQDQEYGKSVCS